MEVVLSVSEAELEEFPEEATESSGHQKQPSESSQAPGTVRSLLSVEIAPTADLLEKIRWGKISYVNRVTPKVKVTGISVKHKTSRQHDNRYSKQPRSLVIDKPIKARKRPGHLDNQ